MYPSIYIVHKALLLVLVLGYCYTYMLYLHISLARAPPPLSGSGGTLPICDAGEAMSLPYVHDFLPRYRLCAPTFRHEFGMQLYSTRTNSSKMISAFPSIRRIFWITRDSTCANNCPIGLINKDKVAVDMTYQEGSMG